MIEDRRGPAPYGVLLAVVVVVIMASPMLFGDGGNAITDLISEMLSPIALLLLPIALLLVIQFLSSERGSVVSSVFNATGSPDSIHRVSGSPVGVALFLILILFLLYNRFSIFGGDDDSGD